MKNLLIGCTLLGLSLTSLTSSTAFGQSVTLNDSTVCVPLWRARLIQADLERKDVLDSIRVGQQKELRLSYHVVKALDSLLTVKQSQLDTVSEININLTHIDGLRQEQMTAKDKYIRKLKLQRTLAIAGGALVILISIL